MLLFAVGFGQCQEALKWPAEIFGTEYHSEGVEDLSCWLEGEGILMECMFNHEKEEVTLVLKDVSLKKEKEGTSNEVLFKEAFSIRCMRESKFEKDAVFKAIGKGLKLVYSETDAQATYYQWHPGQRLSFSGMFSTYSRATNPGAFDYQAYSFAQGIIGQVELEKNQIIVLDVGSRFLTTLQNIRVSVVNRIKALAEEDDVGILICILTGDKSLLTTEWKELYQEGGIMHLLAISGLHISVLGILLYRLLRKLVGDYFISCMVSSLVVGCFCIMVGSGTSVLRAGICFLLYLGAEYLGRQYDLATAVSLAGSCCRLLVGW